MMECCNVGYQLKCQVQKCGKVQLSLFAFDFTKTSSVLPTDRRKSHVRTYGREIDASHRRCRSTARQVATATTAAAASDGMTWLLR